MDFKGYIPQISTVDRECSIEGRELNRSDIHAPSVGSI